MNKLKKMLPGLFLLSVLLLIAPSAGGSDVIQGGNDGKPKKPTWPPVKGSISQTVPQEQSPEEGSLLASVWEYLKNIF